MLTGHLHLHSLPLFVFGTICIGGIAGVGVLGCNVRLQYVHVQEISARFSQISPDFAGILKPALQNISETYDRSTFGVWRMQDKQDPALYCAAQDLRMTTDINKVEQAIGSWTEPPATYSGGSTADELLLYLPSAPEVGWEVGDEFGDDPNTRVVKIISIATSDAAFYYSDGFSSDAMSNYLPEYATYGRAYDPQDTQKCHSTSYPELQVVAKALLEHDVFPIIFTAGNTVSPGIDSTQPAVRQWWATHFGSQYLNVADRATIVDVTNSEQVISAIRTAVSKATCTTTTTTVNVNCNVRLQYLHLLQRNDKNPSIPDGVKTVASNLTSSFPGSQVGLWSTLPRSAGDIYEELPLTADSGLFANAVDAAVRRTNEWSQHMGSGFTDLMWYLPQTIDWRTTDPSLWQVPAIKVLSFVAQDGDWFAEDARASNDGNGYDIPSTVYPDGTYDPLNRSKRLSVSNHDLKSIRESLIDNDVFVMVTTTGATTTGANVSRGFQGESVTEWWTEFLNSSLQIADRFQVCETDTDTATATVLDCVYSMTRKLQAKICDNQVSTTTPTPTPPTYSTVKPSFSCPQVFQVIALTTESAGFQSKFLDTKNDIRYFAKSLLNKFPGSSLGIVSGQNKGLSCATSVIKQSADLGSLLEDIDNWQYPAAPDVQGTNMAEIMSDLIEAGWWDVEFSQAPPEIPKVKVLVLLTDDGTFFHRDGVSSTFDAFGLPFDVYPANNTRNPEGFSGYDPTSVDMCHSTSYPDLISIGKSLVTQNINVVLMYPESNVFQSHIWDVNGTNNTVTTEWWMDTFSKMGVTSYLTDVAGFDSLTNEVGENLIESLHTINSLTCSSLSTFKPCNHMVEYVHILRRDKQSRDVVQTLPELGQRISETYLGSTLSLWSATAKSSHRTSRLEQPLTNSTVKFAAASLQVLADAQEWTNNTPGNAILELLAYIPEAVQTQWSTTTDSDSGSVKIISFYGSDGDFYYDDNITTNDASQYPLPYIQYPTGFDPTNLDMKSTTSYPGLQSIRDAIMNNNIYLVVPVDSTKSVTSGWTTGNGPTWNCVDWWTDFFSNKLNLPADRYRVAKATVDELVNETLLMIEDIRTAGTDSDCSTTTPCPVTAQYIQLVSKSWKWKTQFDSIKTLAANLTATHPGSSVGLWSHAAKSTQIACTEELALTTDASLFASAVETAEAKTEHWNSVGLGASDLLWYLADHAGWSAANDGGDGGDGVPSIRILGLFGVAGDWFGDDGVASNDANSYDSVAGDYDPRNLAMRSTTSYPSRDALRSAIINNDIYVLVMTSPGDNSSIHEYDVSASSWWLDFAVNQLQLPDRILVVESSRTEEETNAAVLLAVNEIRPNVCQTTTTTPIPLPPTTPSPIMGDCAVRFQMNVIQDDSAMYAAELSPNNEYRYLSKHLLENYPGSSIGIFAGQNKNHLCLTYKLDQSDQIDTILPKLDSWVLGMNSPDQRGSDVHELIWYLDYSGQWDLEFGLDHSGIPKLNVLVIATDDGTFYNNDGIEMEHTKYATAAKLYPDGSYNPSNMSECHHSAYPDLRDTSKAILDNDVHILLLSPEERVHSNCWNTQPSQLHPKTFDWYQQYFASMSIPTQKILYDMVGSVPRQFDNLLAEKTLALLIQIQNQYCASMI